jgi:hypothetical protein
VKGEGTNFYDITQVVGGVDKYHIWYDETWCPRITDPWVPTALEMAELAPAPEDIDYYIQRAAAGIYSDGHDSLTFLSELHKLRSLHSKTIKNLGTKIVDILKGLLSRSGSGGVKGLVSRSKRVNWLHELAQLYGDLENDWLAFRYGLRTTLYDLEDLEKSVNAIAELSNRHSNRSGNSYDYNQSTITSGSYSSAYFTETYNDKISVSMRGSVTADIAVSNFRFNPVATAWELLPFSFILDWLVNVGQFIEAMSFDTLATRYSSSGGYKIDLYREYHLQGGALKTGYKYNTRPYFKRYFAHATYSKRTPSPVPFKPLIELRLDDWKALDLSIIIRRLFL